VEKSRAERRLAAIVATDVVGYSRLMGEGEAQTLDALKAHRQELIDPLIAEHMGHIVKTTGDGLLLEFPSVVEAVACAVSIQTGMRKRNLDVAVDRRIVLRIGVNIGDVISEGGDVFGDGVNVAARLQQIAEPGAICLSEDAYRQVRGKIDLDVSYGGAQRLKNIAQPLGVYRIQIGSSSKRPKVGAGPHSGWAGRRSYLIAAVVVGTFSALAAGAVWLDIGRGLVSGSDRQTERQNFPVIAVMPFANQTGDPAHDYFANGVTEEVTNALGKFKSLRVISHAAVLPYKVGPANLNEAADDLGASYLVGGSVRRSENRVRISAQLTEAATATMLWTNRYDGEIADIFDFQDAIARDIAGTLAANITHLELQRHLNSERPDQSAFDLVLRARATGMATSRSANRTYRELVAKAIELDPTYAAAHALLGESIYSQVIVGWTEFPDEALDKAEQLARKAVALAPDESDGYRVLGRVHLIRAEYDQSRSALRRAIEINPSDASAWAVWGTLQAYSGKPSGAIEALEQAFKYNPFLEPEFHFDLAISYYLSDRHQDALRVAERGITRYPNFPMLRVPAAAASARLGQKEMAAVHVAEIQRRLPFLGLDQLGSRFTDPEHSVSLQEGLRLAGL
jgi:adenylate cyclase